ncbi:MAG TPA: hypothetical protein VFW28_02365 [Micropepsaceae bacterium]|nr:hypothetical protein [Micropepsaceae bacterium]
MMRFIAVLLLAVAWPVFAVHAQDAATAFEHYQTGDYEGAIRIGEAANNGPGLAVAARAAFAAANLRDTPCLSCLQRVEALARRSIMLDMTNPDAFVYLAAALGYESRIIGYVRATVQNYPQMAKQAIDRALRDNPNDAWSLAALGGWHMEIVRNGGSLVARTLYGARADAGEDAFRRAFAADPGNLVIRLQYVLSVAAFDLNRYRDEIAGQLATIAMTQPRTAYETAMKQRAARLQDLLKPGRNADFLALIKKYQGYPEA